MSAPRLIPSQEVTAMQHPTPTNENRGLLPVGTVLPDGAEIVAVSLTAYDVRPAQAWAQCEWRSFDAVHGRPAPVMPLVVFS